MYYKERCFISQQRSYYVSAPQHWLAMQLSLLFQPSVSLVKYVGIVFELHAQLFDSMEFMRNRHPSFGALSRVHWSRHMLFEEQIEPPRVTTTHMAILPEDLNLSHSTWFLFRPFFMCKIVINEGAEGKHVQFHHSSLHFIKKEIWCTLGKGMLLSEVCFHPMPLRFYQESGKLGRRSMDGWCFWWYLLLTCPFIHSYDLFSSCPHNGAFMTGPDLPQY